MTAPTLERALTHLLDQILPVGFLRLVCGRRLQSSLDLGFDFLPQASYKFDIYIGFEESRSNFLESRIENLFGSPKPVNHESSSLGFMNRPSRQRRGPCSVKTRQH